MNLKNVLRTYSLLRSLTDDESALLETLRGLSEGEREQLVQSLSPGKVVKKATKKSSKLPLMCGYVFPDDAHPYAGHTCTALEDGPIHRDRSLTGYHRFVKPRKSQRAVSLAEQIKSTGKVARCTYEIDDNGGLTPCDAIATDPIHDKNAGYLGYHEFQPAQAQAATGE